MSLNRPTLKFRKGENGALSWNASFPNGSFLNGSYSCPWGKKPRYESLLYMMNIISIFYVLLIFLAYEVTLQKGHRNFGERRAFCFSEIFSISIDIFFDFSKFDLSLVFDKVFFSCSSKYLIRIAACFDKENLCLISVNELISINRAPKTHC